jgi:exonuclease III
MEQGDNCTLQGRYISIGTWNVEYARNARNMDRLAMMSAYPADIWILTETHTSLDLSSTHTPYKSDPRPIVRNVDAGSTWVTIWSRFKLIDRIEVPDSHRQVAAIFDTPAGRLAVAGVVLPWLSDTGDQPSEPPPKGWEEHRRVAKYQLPKLLENLFAAKNCRHVLAGDFNTVLAQPGYCAGHDGIDSMNAVLVSKGLATHTAHIPYLNSPPYQKLIDHVCSDLGQAQAITTWVGDDGRKPNMSDHPGVVVSFLI